MQASSAKAAAAGCSATPRDARTDEMYCGEAGGQASAGDEGLQQYDGHAHASPPSSSGAHLGVRLQLPRPARVDGADVRPLDEQQSGDATREGADPQGRLARHGLGRHRREGSGGGSGGGGAGRRAW